MVEYEKVVNALQELVKEIRFEYVRNGHRNYLSDSLRLYTRNAERVLKEIGKEIP